MWGNPRLWTTLCQIPSVAFRVKFDSEDEIVVQRGAVGIIARSGRRMNPGQDEWRKSPFVRPFFKTNLDCRIFWGRVFPWQTVRAFRFCSLCGAWPREPGSIVILPFYLPIPPGRWGNFLSLRKGILVTVSEDFIPLAKPSAELSTQIWFK